MIPKITIVGHINSGKSTLFNRLTESRQALVSKIPGTTRDRNIGRVLWRGQEFSLIDTGGVDIEGVKNSIQMLLDKKTFSVRDTMEKNILFQTFVGISEADIILFLVDGKTGVLPQDRELALVLKKLKKPVIVVCNKIDSPKFFSSVHQFYSLGFGEPMGISASNGSGTGDLLDAIHICLQRMKKIHAQTPENKDEIRVSIIGKPNAGKSSLVNSLLGYERVIVSPVPMTTREPQDTSLIYKGKNITLIDTAGLKRRAKTAPELDALSGKRAEGMIYASDIVLYIIDASDKFTSQDLRLSGVLSASLASVILVGNKWDLLQGKSTASDAEVRKYIFKTIHPLDWAPLIFISAKTGKNVNKILDLIVEVSERRKIVISEKAMNAFLKKLIKQKRPIGGTEGLRPKIIKIRQKKTNPPEFTVYLANEADLHFSYYKFIEKMLRSEFDLRGVNMKIEGTVEKTLHL